jgi:hypothetical protein
MFEKRKRRRRKKKQKEKRKRKRKRKREFLQQLPVRSICSRSWQYVVQVRAKLAQYRLVELPLEHSHPCQRGILSFLQSHKGWCCYLQIQLLRQVAKDVNNQNKKKQQKNQSMIKFLGKPREYEKRSRICSHS